MSLTSPSRFLSRRSQTFAILAVVACRSPSALAQQPGPLEPGAEGLVAPPTEVTAGEQPATAPDAGPTPEPTPPDAGVVAPPEQPQPPAGAPSADNLQPAASGAAPSPTVTTDKEESPEEAPGDPWGDGNGGVKTGMLSFRVLLQTRYAHAFAQSSDNSRPGYALREDLLVRQGDGFSLNRFFLRIGADPSKHLGFRAILDFAQLVSGGVGGTVKQAYGTLRPVPKHLEFHAGIFKLPFSTMELDPIAKYELSSLGPTDDLIKDLGFGGRDTGADVMVAPLHKSKLLRLFAGAFRGQAKDEHASPVGAIGARIESSPIKELKFGADVVDQPYALTYRRPFDTSNKDVLPMADPLFPRAEHWASGAAYSADVTFEHKRLMLRGEGMIGTRVDLDTRYGARSFWAVWALAAYRFRAGPVRLMPALRAEWLDADREHSVGLRRMLTAGVTCFFSRRARLLLDVMRTDVQDRSPLLSQPLPLAGFPYFELSNTRVVAQLQVEI